MSKYINTPEYFPTINYMQLYKSDKLDNLNKPDMKNRILEIEDDVNKLKDSFELLNKIVTQQHAHIETLEEHVNNTKQNVKEAKKNIKFAADYNYSSYLWYLGGLAVGSLAYFSYAFTTGKKD
jgi:hypothetical protein